MKLANLATSSIGSPPLQRGIAEQDLDRFSEFFYKQTGIIILKEKYSIIERRLMSAMELCNCPDFRQFFLKIRTDRGGREMQEAINALTVNETYFYRENYQFDALATGVLPEITGPGASPRRIRIWSLPCSTGEEPYSIAIYLLENWPGIHLHDVEIVGSDIDTNVLKAAREAVYSERSVSRIPAQILQKYFKAAAPGKFKLSEDITSAISISKANILDRASCTKFRNFDVIFCRNLLIYFDDASRREAINNIYDSLRPGGYVFLGHSESMSRISSVFEPRRHGSQIIYRRPLQ